MLEERINVNAKRRVERIQEVVEQQGGSRKVAGKEVEWERGMFSLSMNTINLKESLFPEKLL